MAPETHRGTPRASPPVPVRRTASGLGCCNCDAGIMTTSRTLVKPLRPLFVVLLGRWMAISESKEVRSVGSGPFSMGNEPFSSGNGTFSLYAQPGNAFRSNALGPAAAFPRVNEAVCFRGGSFPGKAVVRWTRKAAGRARSGAPRRHRPLRGPRWASFPGRSGCLRALLLAALDHCGLSRYPPPPRG